MHRPSSIKSGTLYIIRVFSALAFLFAIVFFINIHNVKAVDDQEFDFAVTYGGPGTGFNVAEPFNLITDADGNIYMAGYFQNVIDFDPGPGTVQLTATSTSDLYVQKLDADGNLIWVKQFTGTASGSFINSIGLDSNGNIFGTGYFRGTVDFDPGAGSFPLTALGTNQNDTFVFKLDSDGNFVWATQHSGLYQDQGEKLVIGPDDNVYVAGYFAGTVDFDPGAGVYNISSLGTVNRDGFVFKLDNDGNFVWANAYQSTTDVSDQLSDMIVDSSGNITVVGNFSGTLDFDFGAGTQELIGSSFDMFVNKMDEDGNFISVFAVFSNNVVTPQFLELDDVGNIFVSGAYSGTADFDPGAGTFNITGTSVRFISKFDSSGNFEWVGQFGDSTAPRWTALKSDSDGAIYGFGRITAIRDMDPGAGTVNINPTDGRVFLLKLDTDGVYEWTKQFTGGATNGLADELYIDEDDNVFVSGDFDGTGDFDPGAGVYNIADTNTTGPYDAFMVKLATPVPVATAPTVTTAAASGVAATAATLNGEITAEGTAAPTERGFEYGLDNTYGTTVSDTGTFTTGVFSEAITGLTCNTLYHFRAFATSPDGTGNGSDQTFTTSACPVAPTVITAAASGIAATAATLNGEITAEGTAAPTERGFEYGLTNAYGTTVSDAGTFTIGVFNEILSGLTCNTLYHFRAFATSPDGTGNGSDQTFTTTACPVSGGGSSGSRTNDENEQPVTTTPPVAPSEPAPTPTNENPTSTNTNTVTPSDDNPVSETPEENPQTISEEPNSNSSPEQSGTAPVQQNPQSYPEDRTTNNILLSYRSAQGSLTALNATNLVLLLMLIPIATSSIPFATIAAGLGLGITGVRLLYLRYFYDLLSFLGIRKKRRVWGTVYDSKTKQPLDPAVVELINAETGEVMERAITDLAGRFGFLATSGVFMLRASKTHYAFPSIKEAGTSDEIFDNLYHGERLTLAEGSTLVTPNIPMDAVDYDWNQDAKQKLVPSRLRREYIVQLLFNILFTVGFIFAILNIFLSPNLWNYFVLAMYFVVLILRFIIGRKRLWGRLLRNGQPLAGARLELTEPQLGVVMGKAHTAPDGKFFLKTPQPGQYKLSIKLSSQAQPIWTGQVTVGKESVYNEELNI